MTPFLNADRSHDVIGRDREQERLERLLADAHRGSSGVLVVRGEPGIGKTALLDDVANLAAGCTVIRVVGVESEFEVPFAALHRIVLPLHDGVAGLPPPQRAALESAFGMSSAVAPALLMVGLAALSLLARAAATRPLVCIVDDAQWIDRPSIESLGFVGRRLEADGVVLLFGLRDGPSAPPGLEALPELRLGGLSRASAYRLLEHRDLRPDTIARLVEETTGNPLALLELAAEPELPPGATSSSMDAPLTPRLEALYARQVRALPPDAQTFLLLAAAEPDCEVETLLRAAGHLGVGVEGSGPAEASGLITLGTRATFRHPLIRAAVYGAALEVDRRGAHDALARAFYGLLEPDRRAWHRGIAAVAPDEAAAVELERSGSRARARRGYVAESRALERAAGLSADPERRGQRLLAAAGAAQASGDGLRVFDLLEQAGPLSDEPLLAARAHRLRGVVLPRLGRLAEASGVLADAARQLEPLDVRLARDTWFEALQFAVMSHASIVGTTPEDVARGALAAPTAGSPTAVDLLLTAIATRIADGHERAAPLLREAVDTLRERDDISDVRPHVAFLGHLATQELMDHGSLQVLMRRLERGDRREGSRWLHVVLRSLASCAWMRGDPDAADALFIEAAQLVVSQTARFRVMPGVDVEWLAWQGAEAQARAAAEANFVAARDFGTSQQAEHARVALAILDNSLGNYEAALDHALPVFDADPISFGGMVLPELVEAAVRCGRREMAEAAGERLAERSRANATPRCLSLSARCAAQLAEGEAADELFRQALAHNAATSVKTDRARTHLLYGEWLRRQRRRHDAREHLRTAYEQFTAMRCLAFAERARIELLATGERARARTPDMLDALTPQETQIARLAAGRATNGEIAARLFISESTVAYHLRKVFRKLEVTSRRELHGVLTTAPAETEPAPG